MSNPNSLGPLVEQAELVVSYVPAFLHIHVAKICIEKSRHMITTSYVTPETKALDKQVKNKNLIFLNQLGLDPGIDHLATMKIIQQVQKQGGKILESESWCGGLPSPSDCNNPLGYKFTWSSIGAFRAFNSKAVFLQENKEIEIQAVIYSILAKKQYLIKLFNFKDIQTGTVFPKITLWAQGCVKGIAWHFEIQRLLHDYQCTKINWSYTRNPVHGESWLQHIEFLLKDEEGNSLESKIFNRCVIKVKHYESLNEQQKNSKAKEIEKAFKYFDLLSHQSKIHDKSKSSLENLIKLLEPKLNLKEGETDLIAMQHLFVIEKEGKKYL